jgi:hypothetical protein
VIGQIAESHHWPAHHVAETLERRHVSAPPFLPAEWTVDAFKVACLLRTADAAHIDGQRAPWFLFALRRPEGISLLHWRFQAKMGQPVWTERGELRLSSGSPFEAKDRQAWWLAYEVACMINREVRDAQTLMSDAARLPFATVSVEHVTSPQLFATNVRTIGWEPVDVGPKISDIPKVISNLGGAMLYGNRPAVALRELIQNAADAVRALRALGEIGEKEGEIEIALTPGKDVTWLHVTDTGIGMSRFVLTEVLLDFGNSLWGSESLRTELPGLASKGFRAVGRFGIGFFSVFMLGHNVLVTTRRFSRVPSDDSDQWLLEFEDGLNERPTLSRPTSTNSLPKHGTRVSVATDNKTLHRLSTVTFDPSWDTMDLEDKYRVLFSQDLRTVIANLCPTLDVKVSLRIGTKHPVTIVTPNDWQKMKPLALVRCAITTLFPAVPEMLLDLRETSGALLGRIGYVASNSAVVTYGGMRAGTIPNLAGVLLGENNSDLARSKSRPVASREAWQRWAEKWIDSVSELDAEAFADLQPLCPGRDLPVYRIKDAKLSEAELIEWLRSQHTVRVFEGFPTHEDTDDISNDRFDHGFELTDGIIILPAITKPLAQALGFPLIDYTDRLEFALRTAWGEFEKSMGDDEPIGDVDGLEIIRRLTRYARAM